MLQHDITAEGIAPDGGSVAVAVTIVAEHGMSETGHDMRFSERFCRCDGLELRQNVGMIPVEKTDDLHVL